MPPDEIRYVIQRAVTDLGREIVFSDAPEKAGVNNLMEIYELLTQQSRQAIVEHFAGKGYAVLKREVAEVVIDALRQIRERYQTLIANGGELDAILEQGAESARSVAEPKIHDIKHKVGLLTLPNHSAKTKEALENG
jgi:tryptophanyl-tRNA synthetase